METSPTIPKESLAKSERLSNEQVDNLLAAIGNSEAKAITLLIMKSGFIYSSWTLHQEFIKAQGTPKGWIPANPTPFGWCEQSLAPIGLVAQEVVDANLNKFGYAKTSYGQTNGTILAGLLLDFSNRHPEVHLIDLFGTTSSPAKSNSTEEGEDYRKRAPSLRRKIFWELATAQLPIREVDLMQSIGENYRVSINRHLETLDKKGIIKYLAVKQEERSALYRINRQTPTGFVSYSADPTLSGILYDLLDSSDNPEMFLNIDELAKNSREALNNMGRPRQASDREFERKVSSILRFFEDKGIVERDKFSKETRSEINLTPSQRELLVELVTLLDGFQNQDPAILERGYQLAAFFQSHPDQMSKILAKAKESSHAEDIPVAETASYILSILKDNPNSSRRAIRQVIEEKYGRRITPENMEHLIKFLSDQDLITVSEVVKGIYKYSRTEGNKAADPNLSL